MQTARTEKNYPIAWEKGILFPVEVDVTYLYSQNLSAPAIEHNSLACLARSCEVGCDRTGLDKLPLLVSASIALAENAPLTYEANVQTHLCIATNLKPLTLANIESFVGLIPTVPRVLASRSIFAARLIDSEHRWQHNGVARL